MGLAEAGKIIIVRHLTGRPVPKYADRTVGIDITPDWKPLDGAGQTEYYSPHQLFLTKGALFMLVVDPHAFFKEVQNEADNFTDSHKRVLWSLDMLHIRVPGAAIILVWSHADLLERADAARAVEPLNAGEASRFLVAYFR